PTVAAAARLATSVWADQPVTAFLRANRDFDLLTGNVAATIAAGVKGFDAQQLGTQLGALQRVYRIAPKPEHLQALINNGMHSSFQVVRVGRNAFVANYAPVIGERSAKLIYERAVHASAAAQHLIANHHAYNNVDLPWIPPGPTSHPDIPN